MAWLVEKKNGWLVRWMEPGRKTRSKYFHELSDAEAYKATKDGEALARQVLDPNYRAPWELDGPPLPGYEEAYRLETYMTEMVRTNRSLRETTTALYLRIIRVHIAGTPLGQADIRYISADDLSSWWAGLTAGPGALRNVAQLVTMAFRRAVRQGVIDVNPMDRAEIRKPAGRQRAVRPPTTEQVEALADAAVQPRDRMEILMMAYGGLRAGEVGGLRLQDVDLNRAELHLEQQVVRTAEGLKTTRLKTDAARRVVTLPGSVMDELRTFIRDHPPAFDGRLFHGQNDSYRDAVRINTSVQKAAKRAGLETHAHALRHSAVSAWVADGASPVDVQHMVGHSDVRMTLGVYGHLFSYGGADLAARMEARREQHRSQ